MSDENATPNSGNEQTPGNPPVEPRVYTEADIQAMRLAGDHEGVKRAVEQLQRLAQGEEPLPEPQPDNAGKPPEEGDAQPQPQPQPDEGGGDDGRKSFDIRFRGAAKSYDDADGYLGNGDFGRMKKELAHARAMIEDYETRYVERSGEVEATTQKNRSLNEQVEALRSRVSELESENKKLATVQPQQPSQTDAQQPVGDIPEPPVRPDIPDDPFEWTPEQREQNIQYRKARDEYDKKIAGLLRRAVTPTSRTQQPAAPAQQPAAPATELPSDVKEAVEYFRRKKEQDAVDVAAAGRKAYWDDFRDFQGKHSEYATPVDIEALNTQIGTWMNRLAFANGYELKPGATPEQRAQYETLKKQLAYRYSNGDATVIANAEGCPAPKGYEQYVKLANLSKTLKTFKQELIKRGTLAENASMHDVWLHYYSENEMGDDIQRMEADAVGRGAKDTMTALENHQRNDAVNLPNNLPAGKRPPTAPGEFSPEEVQRLLALTPYEMSQHPELVERRKKLMAQIAATQ